MPLCILSDAQVADLLEGLEPQDVLDFGYALGIALHDFSTQSAAEAASVGYQCPHRLATENGRVGATTLYMPASGPDGSSVKVLTLPSPAPAEAKEPFEITGVVTLFGPRGEVEGLVHAKTLTAFRTALASNCLLVKRRSVKTITVFGSGLQAYWHIRLALKLRGHEIKRVHIQTRAISESAMALLDRLHAVPPATKAREGWADLDDISLLTPAYADYQRLHAQQVERADVIFCCTPATEPLFDPDILLSREGRLRGRLIVAIGSYRPHMHELPQALLHEAVKSHRGHHHAHKHAHYGGVIIVDTIEGALTESGEIIDAQIDPSRLLELGELVMLRRLAIAEGEQGPDAALVSPNPSSRSSSSISSGVQSISLDGDSDSMSSLSLIDARAVAEENCMCNERHAEGAASRAVQDVGSDKQTEVKVGVDRVDSSASEDSKDAGTPGSRDNGSQDKSSKSSSTDSRSHDGSLSSRLAKHLHTPLHNHNHKHKHSDRTKVGRKSQDTHGSMMRWLQDGSVVYKSVGVGVMDLVIGRQIVTYARQKNIGLQVDF